VRAAIFPERQRARARERETKRETEAETETETDRERNRDRQRKRQSDREGGCLSEGERLRERILLLPTLPPCVFSQYMHETNTWLELLSSRRGSIKSQLHCFNSEP